MGLFSKIKKGVKKAFKGVKNVVSGVAKGIKKVAKKVAYTIPGGKQLWKLGTKVGQGITKGLKKVGKGIIKGIGKLGPVGIIGIQMILSATGLGAGIAAAMGSMWSSMGAVAAASAQAGSLLGTVANGAIQAANWVGGTLGAVGDAIIGGGKELLSGNFSAAAETLGTNITKAFTGEAGTTALSEAATSQLTAKMSMDAGVGIFDQAATAASDALYNSGGTFAQMGSPADKGFSAADMNLEPVVKLDPELMAPQGVPNELPQFQPDFSKEAIVESSVKQAGLSSEPLITYDQLGNAVEANKSWYQKATEATLNTGKELLGETGTKVLANGLRGMGEQGGGGAYSYQPAGYQAMSQGQAMSAPTFAQGLTAAPVGGQRYRYGY